MYRGTTPYILLTVEDYDLTFMTVYVTFKTRSGGLLTKTGNDLQVLGSDIMVHLTQKETLALSDGPCNVQVRFIGSDNEAYTTDKALINIEDVLCKDVITYKGGSGS